MSDIVSALMMTLIGMGLVFVIIVIMWGFMWALVKFTAEKPNGAAEANNDPEASAPVEAVLPTGLKARAAAAAVAVALAMGSKSASLIAPTSSSVSAWQAAQRANYQGLRDGLYLRKPKG